MSHMPIFLVAAALAVWPALSPAAAPAALELESASYRVHLGVVPARQIEQQPELVDRDKTLHGGIAREPGTQHLTVSVLDRQRGTRVTDATVIAAVRHKRWGQRRKVERPLERMQVGGVVSYGNYFPMPEHGEYEIVLRIYATAGDAPETVRFTYKRPE